jgi:uncharacterized protein YjiS (DUF1127 family)
VESGGSGKFHGGDHGRSNAPGAGSPQAAKAAAGKRRKEPEMSTTKTMPAHGGQGTLTPMAWLLRGMEMIEAWHARARSRRALLELPDAMLKDVGLTRADAWDEGRKLFWQR